MTIAGVTMHLAAWRDPAHWEDAWRAHAGDQDVDEFVASLITQATV